MRKEYDFTNSVRNPYAKHFRKQVTIRLGTEVIAYFKMLAQKTGVKVPELFKPCFLYRFSSASPSGGWVFEAL